MKIVVIFVLVESIVIVIVLLFIFVYVIKFIMNKMKKVEIFENKFILFFSFV